MKKKLFKLLTISFLVLLLFGCGLSKNNKKDFIEEDFRITLTEKFEKKDLANFTYYYQSDTALVTALKETFESVSSVGLTNDSSALDYLTKVATLNSKNSEIKARGNYNYFEYESTISGETFYYLCVGYKSDDAFWLLNFGCQSSNKDILLEQFFEWADSVKF